MKLRNKMVMMGVLAALPLASQAGLSVKIDDLSNGVGWDLVALDNGANDGLFSGVTGILDTGIVSGNGLFSVTAESGAPSDWTLTDIQLHSQIAAGTSWIVEVLDDSYVGSGIELFETKTTPTVIENGTIDLVSMVEGTTILNETDLSQGVTSATASATLNDPFTIKHTFTFTNTSGSEEAKFTLDTTTTAVSEPGTLALVGVALAALGFRRKSKS